MINISAFISNEDIRVYPTINSEEKQTTLRIGDVTIFIDDERAKELAEMILKTIGEKKRANDGYMRSANLKCRS